MKARIVVVLCDPGVELACLEDSLNCIFFQSRKPDRVVAGISEGSPERIKAISRFGFEVAAVPNLGWGEWIHSLVAGEREARLSLMEAGQYWPVGRLRQLESIDGAIVRGPTGYLFPQLGAEWDLHLEPPAADPSLDEVRDFIRVASTTLFSGRDLVDGFSVEPLCKLSERVRSAPNVLTDRSAATFFRHSKVRENEVTTGMTKWPALASFRNKHAGRRAFVVGNGPSLSNMDLNPLESEITFASNGIFLLFPKTRFRPDYYCCMDSVVLPDRASDIRSMLDAHSGITGFFPNKIGDHDAVGMSWWVPSIIGNRPNVCFYESRWADLSGDPWRAVSRTPWEFIHEGRSVTINLIQLAYLMGCNPIYLIGCDTEYTVPLDVQVLDDFTDRPDRRFISSGDDPNHFDPNYFGIGRIWHNPNPEFMIYHYQAVQGLLAPQGVQVFNATMGGKLEVFPRVAYGSLFTSH